MMMKQGEWVKRVGWLGVFCGAVVWFVLLAAPMSTAVAQGETTVQLTIRLRDSNGRALAGEVVKLSRLPEETAVACTTDAEGRCAWPVTPGLYQFLFTRPLDDISAAILGESGLHGLGVMVGAAPNGETPNGETPNGGAPIPVPLTLTYHFTFHSDDRVYFDMAPDSPLPVPKIPTAEEAHGHVDDHADEQIPPIVPVTTAVFAAAAPITTTQPTTVSTTTAVPAVSPIATPSPSDTQPARLSPVFILLLAAAGGAGFGYLTQRFTNWRAGCKDAPATPTDTKDGR
ncbi:MAG: carboxypeptidase regulatory-like domain-containing protein [Chloroflexi bacterium]|nr:carboxypeptidase regulatory-like domain-containing protein [Chloroflexota bacterium]